LSVKSTTSLYGDSPLNDLNRKWAFYITSGESPRGAAWALAHPSAGRPCAAFGGCRQRDAGTVTM